MLLYHFKDKNDLVATVLGVSNRALGGGHPRAAALTGRTSAVLDLWAG